MNEKKIVQQGGEQKCQITITRAGFSMNDNSIAAILQDKYMNTLTNYVGATGK